MPSTLNFTAQDIEQLIDEEQVTKLLKISPGTLIDWVQTNRIRYFRLGWRTIRFRLSDVLDFIERSAVPAKETPAPSRIAKKPRTKPACVSPLG